MTDRSASEPAERVATRFVFSPRTGLERLFGRVRSVTIFEAEMSESFGDWVEGTPVKSVSERYDETGAIRERDRFDPSGALVDKAVYGYDGDGRLRERTHFDGEGRARLRYSYHLDGDGRPSEMVGVDVDGAVRSRLARRYGADGRLDSVTEWHDREGGEEEVRWRIDYGAPGDIRGAEGEILHDGRPAGHICQRYDQAGNVAETARFRVDGEPEEVVRFLVGPQRERDNWVRRVTERGVRRFGTERFEPARVTYRRFVFYPD